MIRLIEPNGTEHVFTEPGEPTLQQMYGWLDCTMIEVPGGGFLVGGREWQFVVDEEGKLDGKPENPTATILYDAALRADPRGLQPGRDVLVGNVLILTEPNLMR